MGRVVRVTLEKRIFVEWTPGARSPFFESRTGSGFLRILNSRASESKNRSRFLWTRSNSVGAVIVAFFLLAQSIVGLHGEHDHSDDAEHETDCVVCIAMAASDDDELAPANYITPAVNVSRVAKQPKLTVFAPDNGLRGQPRSRAPPKI